MRNLKVTVYISTCNRLEKLKRAVNSVLSQSYDNIELIISDDASNDGTEEYASNLVKDMRGVKYLRNERNEGACVTRNAAIKNATGYYITGLDDDDEFECDRIEHFVREWDDRYSFICSDFFDEYSNGERKKHYNIGKDFIGDFNAICLENLASNQIFTIKDRLVKIGGFRVDVKKLQDWDTWIKMVHKYGSFKRLTNPTYIMHHDHGYNEKRVSTSYPLSKALEELLNRNLSIYSDRNRKIMEFIISCENRDATFNKAVEASFISKNIKYCIKYFYFKIKG